MNLDLLPVGWMHLGASLLALVAGTLVLLWPKGTPVHKRCGQVYALALLVTSVTALGVYRRGIGYFNAMMLRRTRTKQVAQSFASAGES